MVDPLWVIRKTMNTPDWASHSCQSYCESQQPSLQCADGWDDISNRCESRSHLGCSGHKAGTSDIICRCQPPIVLPTMSPSQTDVEAATSEPSCVTRSAAGVGAGHPCMLPFSYEGVTYCGCTRTGNSGTPWCATSTDGASSQLPTIVKGESI